MPWTALPDGSDLLGDSQGFRQQDACARELRLVELEARPLVAVLVEAPVEEGVLPVPRALYPLEELLRDDLVGVDIVPV